MLLRLRDWFRTRGRRASTRLLLNRRRTRDVTHYLVWWRGHTSADDAWLRAKLQHCPDKVAEYEASPAARLERAGAAAPLQPSSSSLCAGAAVDTLLDAASHADAVGPARLPCPASGWGITRVRDLNNSPLVIVLWALRRHSAVTSPQAARLAALGLLARDY